MSERETALKTNAFEDDEPSSVPEGTLDVWSAPLRQPVSPKVLSTDDFYALLRILEVLPIADPFLTDLQSKLSDEERRQYGNHASHLSGPEFVREIERIEALIQARLVAAGADPVPPQVCQWREIATAPKDRWVWFGRPASDCKRKFTISPYRWDESHGMWFSGTGWWGSAESIFTHWCEMREQPPTPPVALVPAEGEPAPTAPKSLTARAPVNLMEALKKSLEQLGER